MVYMSSLSDKLKSLGVQIGAQDLAPAQDAKPPNPELEKVFPGSWCGTRSGSVFVIQKSYPALYYQGEVSIYPEHPLDVIGDWAGADQLGELPLDRFVFIDTETTGLSGGAGTYTFLIGAGKFIENEFQIRQFFMSDPAEEAAQLTALEEYLAPAEVVVSYNGKAFDLPRLRTRYKIHGWPPPLSQVIHIDLLHLMRRLYGAVLPNCTLGTIEHDLLKFIRSSQDIPGWQVAERYFQFLQTRDPDSLRGLFYHNEMDVLSMPAVLNTAASCLYRPQRVNPTRIRDIVSIARFYRHLQDFDRAADLYHYAIERADLKSGEMLTGLKELSFMYKRAGRLDQAVSLWRKAADQEELYAHVELAKAFEHRYVQYAEAVHWTLAAIDLHRKGRTQPPYAESLDELKYRLSRLKVKITKKRTQQKEE
jgi:hypothetical protein